VAPSGDIYYTDIQGYRIYKIDNATELITVFAGTGVEGDTGDGGLAINAEIGRSRSLAIGPNGFLYFSDFYHHIIRRIDLNTNIISRYVGTGTSGYSGDGGLAINAEINFPIGMDLNNEGELFFADSNTSVIRKVDQNGIISTVIPQGEFNLPQDILLDNDENIFVMDLVNAQIKKYDNNSNLITVIAGNGNFGYSGDGGLAVNAEISAFGSMTIDSQDKLIYTETSNNVIREIDLVTGIINTRAGNGVNGYCGDGSLATLAVIGNPFGVTLNNDNDLLITQWISNGIRVIGNNQCSVNLSVQPQIILAREQNNDVDIKSEISIRAKQKIGRIIQNLSVEYSSEKEINLEESFEVYPDNTVHLFIEDCGN